MQNISMNDPSITAPTHPGWEAKPSAMGIVLYLCLSLTSVAVLIGRALFFGEHITLAPVAGFVVIASGILIVARGLQKA